MPLIYYLVLQFSIVLFTLSAVVTFRLYSSIWIVPPIETISLWYFIPLFNVSLAEKWNS